MRIALYQPDIPQNTGTILRLGACLNVAVDIILPAGFDFGDKSLRRAGLDYLDHVDFERHQSFESFLAWRDALIPRPRLVLLSTRAEERHIDFSFHCDDILLFGRESSGVPEMVRDRADHTVKVPMQVGMRSLNVAVAASIVTAEALRQTGGFAS